MDKLILGESLEALIDHRGRTPKKLGGEFTETGIPVISAQIVLGGYVDTSSARKISEEMWHKWMPVPTSHHDVILTSEAPLGRCALIPDDASYALGQRVFGLRGKKEVLDSRYLYYALQSPIVQEQLTSRSSGTTVLGIRQTELVQVEIPDPGFIQQKYIATLLGALDDKIALNERIIEASLELAKQIYLKSSHSPSWKTITLDSAAKWLSGGTPKTSEQEFWEGDTPWISAKSLKSPLISQSERNLTELGTQSGTRMVGKGSVIFVVRGSSLKEEFRVGITQREVAFGQDCKALIAREDIEPHTLFHAIRSRTPEILNMVDETGIGAGRLSTDLISKLEIRVPASPNDETSTRLRLLDEQSANSQSESRTLAELRDTLLPQLMSGKLRVKDAEKLVEDAT